MPLVTVVHTKNLHFHKYNVAVSITLFTEKKPSYLARVINEIKDGAS